MANILVGISGSIAAYKTVLYIRELTKAGHHCKVILTEGGAQFVTAPLFAGLGCEVYTDNSLNLNLPNEAMLHINLAKWADLFVIAPASANCLARIAHGFSDNLLNTVVLAYGKGSIYIAPAMNQQMWANSLTQANLTLLKTHNFIIWEPNSGIQACGDNGMGRLLEPEELLAETLNILTRNTSLANKTVLITLGATIEPIDPVRFISNYSSGKMGLALINELLSSGAKVIAIHGKVDIKLPNHNNLQVIPAYTVEEMLNATIEKASFSDVLIGCAAVCDYRSQKVFDQKLKKTVHNSITLELIKNPDIIKTVKAKFPDLMVVGFAGETENLLENAKLKIKQKNLDLIVGNNVSDGKVFSKDRTQILLINKERIVHEFPESSKREAAQTIIQYISKHLLCL